MQLPIAQLAYVAYVWQVELPQLRLYFAHALLLEEALQPGSFLNWHSRFGLTVFDLVV